MYGRFFLLYILIWIQNIFSDEALNTMGRPEISGKRKLPWKSVFKSENDIMYNKVKFRFFFSKNNLLQQVVSKSPIQICSQLGQLHYMKIKHHTLYPEESWRIMWYKIPQLLFCCEGAWEKDNRFRASPGILIKKH